MVEEDPDVRWVLVAAEPITDVDTTAADMLEELDAWLNERSVSLVFAEMKDPVRDKIERYELTRTIDPNHFYPTLDEAVAAYAARDRRELAATARRGAADDRRRQDRLGAGLAAAARRLAGPGHRRRRRRLPRRRRPCAAGTSCSSTVASLSVLVGVGLDRAQPPRRQADRRRSQSGAVALAVFVVVVIASESLRVLLVALGLAVLTVAAARVALAQRRGRSGPERPAARRPTHPVLIMNLKSGGGKAERFGLVDRCRERGIEPVVLTPGSDLLQLAEDAVARGADVIGMAGGDGSQALVASVASRHGLPFVVVPAGTRNHFALDLGLDRDDVVGALDAFTRRASTRVIDLAEVNGRVFVNNASMGVYAKIVQSEEYRDAKVQTTAAMLPELLGPDATPLDLRFTLPGGDEATTAQLLLVSNNPYQLSGLRGAGTRERMDDGLLGRRLAARRRGARREQAGRAGGRRPAVALLRLQPVGGRRVRGPLRDAGRDRGRRRGHDPRTTPAVRDPAGSAHGPPAALGRRTVAGDARRCTSPRVTPSRPSGATARGKPVRQS